MRQGFHLKKLLPLELVVVVVVTIGAVKSTVADSRGMEIIILSVTSLAVSTTPHATLALLLVTVVTGITALAHLFAIGIFAPLTPAPASGTESSPASVTGGSQAVAAEPLFTT